MLNRAPWWRTRWVTLPAKTAGVLLGLAILVLAGWFWWRGVPELYAPGDSSAIATTRTGLLAGLVGIGALGTLWLNNRTYRVTARTFQLTEQGQLTDRFTKANELLGNSSDESIAVRLGGIYALQQLALDTGRLTDQAAVVEVLSAFVRLNYKIDIEPEDRMHEYDPQAAQRGKPKADVLAAISVLAQLPNRGLMRADFTEVDFGDADLSDAHGRLKGGNLEGVNIWKCRMYNSDLRGINLRGANLRLVYFGRSDLRKALLQEAKLQRAVLKEANFQAADLRGADLSYSWLNDAKLAWADLRGANLFEAVLAGADLRFARFGKADFDWASLGNADIRWANLRRARNLSQRQLDGAIGNRWTRLPSYVKRPEAWTTRTSPSSD